MNAAKSCRFLLLADLLDAGVDLGPRDVGQAQLMGNKTAR